MLVERTRFDQPSERMSASMNGPNSLRQIPESNAFRRGDVFVLFGELFGRGYANGLVQDARSAGMEIIGITVGRRDEQNRLRPLDAAELAAAEANLGGKIINVPLMAGFDLDAPDGEPTPTDLVNKLSLKTWQDAKFDWAHIERCREVGERRFTASVADAMRRLDAMIADGRNVFFAHTMAGGIPRAKVLLAIINHVYKGRGDRFQSSDTLLNSDLGKLILMNFDAVTANTFAHLIEESAAIRTRIVNSGGKVSYSAYGYHGSEILIDGRYQWQTYTSYTQGYAKMRLERIARDAWQEGVSATVFNCPEIRTNSSDIFVGVELSLIPLLAALKKEGGGAWAESQWAACGALLSEGHTLEEILARLNALNTSETFVRLRDFAAWPMPNNPQLAESMISTSEDIVRMHKDRKSLITDHLSSLVIEAAGGLMLREMGEPHAPVLWLNHDIIARELNRLHA
jgi:hypothetical protein